MCGIWAAILEALAGRDVKQMEQDFREISPRGPDQHAWIREDIHGLLLGFHRLAIMDPSPHGNQPFIHFEGPLTTYLACNGEIYNWHELAQEYDLNLKSNSDCEAIFRLFLKLQDVDAVSRALRGVFAFAIVVTNSETGQVTLLASRDRFGVRPLFMGWNIAPNGRVEVGVFSEIKAGVNGFDNIKVFPPGSSLRFDKSPDLPGYPVQSQWWSLPNTVPRLPVLKNSETHQIASILDGVRNSLTEAVSTRLHADRPTGFLLSGGLDSSLVAAIGAAYWAKQGKKISTFCIGSPDSTDVRWARSVAEHIGSNHTEVPFDTHAALAAIPDVIATCESYDITTIRASVGQYLVCKWIAENTDIKVVLIGDGADEVAMGYIYTQNNPSVDEAHHDSLRLLREIHFFDVLRADRAVSCHGLETRVPFLDHHFVQEYLAIPTELRLPRDGYTKALIREAFQTTGLLPKDALWRRKEAFSDGVSSTEDSWYAVIQRWAEAQVTDDEWAAAHWTYTHNPPHSKEALLYRRTWERLFNRRGHHDHVVPHFWLPKWSPGVTDPSARTLSHYHAH